MPYAVMPSGSWRQVENDWPLASGEVLVDAMPGQSWDEYLQAVADGVSLWLSSYVNTTYGYDNIISAASYAGDKNPKFNAEGTAAKAWRSDCFVALYAAMPTYQAMPPEQWPTLDYVTANLPQPSSYQWEPING